MAGALLIFHFNFFLFFGHRMSRENKWKMQQCVSAHRAARAFLHRESIIWIHVCRRLHRFVEILWKLLCWITAHDGIKQRLRDFLISGTPPLLSASLLFFLHFPRTQRQHNQQSRFSAAYFLRRPLESICVGISYVFTCNWKWNKNYIFICARRSAFVVCRLRWTDTSICDTFFFRIYDAWNDVCSCCLLAKMAVVVIFYCILSDYSTHKLSAYRLFLRSNTFIKKNWKWKSRGKRNLHLPMIRHRNRYWTLNARSLARSFDEISIIQFLFKYAAAVLACLPIILFCRRLFHLLPL